MTAPTTPASITYSPRESPFHTIYVDVTHRCQMNCANCYLPNRTIPDMNPDLLFDCLKQLPRKTDLRIIGGEPTLRSDLPHIIEEITALGHRPMLITNGLKLADYTYAETLKKSGLNYAQISMNGLDDDQIYLQTDRMACAEQKVLAHRNCEDVGISASISCLLIRDINTHLIPRLFEFAMTKRRPARINLRNIGSVGRNMGKEHAPLTMDEIVILVAKASGLSTSEVRSFHIADNQIRLPLLKNQRRSQQIFVKITDWTIFDVTHSSQIKDPKSHIRGRITSDFRVAPSFEHIKANEFGY